MPTRHRYLLLAAWGAVLLVARWDVHADWPFFVTAGDALLGDDPLRVYAEHPDIQIGPLSLLAALPLSRGDWGPYVAKVLILGLGLVAVRCAELTAERLRGPAPRRTLVTGLLLLPLWTFLGTSGHLDDALALTAVLAATTALARGRDLPAGLLVGLAVTAKPWALMVLPMLLARGRTTGTRSLAVAAGTVAAGWSPFLIGAPDTLHALASFHFPLRANSALHLVLGLPPGTDYPGWVRPVQFGAALLAAGALTRRGRWWAVPAAAFLVRVLLEPGDTTYYCVGVGIGVLLVELVAGVGAPVLSGLTLAGLTVPTYLQLWLIRLDRIPESIRFAEQAAWLRIATVCALLVLLTTRSTGAGHAVRPVALGQAVTSR